MAPRTVTASEAAHIVGVSEKTMLRWLAAGRVEDACKVMPLGEAARWEVPVDALADLRRSPRQSSDLEARVEELEAIIASLRQRASWLFTESGAFAGRRDHSAATGTLDDLGDLPPPPRPLLDPLSAFPVQLRPPRRRQGASEPPAGKSRLPEGWISYNRWCEQHNVNRRSAEQEIAKDQLPRPKRGEWWERPQDATRSAYTMEQHLAASRFAALRWSNRFIACDTCRPHLAALPGRSEVPTVPVGARRIIDEDSLGKGDV